MESAAVESEIGTCLEKDPEDRWQAVRDIKRALALPGAPAAPPGRKWWAAAAALMLAILAAGGFAAERFRPAPVAAMPLLRFEIAAPRNGQLVLGTNPREGGIALSPDATTAAIVATVDGKTGLWLSPLDGSPPRLVEEAANPAYPFWSPDSKSVAFLGSGILQRVDVKSGAVLKVCAVPGFGVGGAWLEDGTILIGRMGSGLMRVDSSGGTPTPLTHLETVSACGVLSCLLKRESPALRPRRSAWIVGNENSRQPVRADRADVRLNSANESRNAYRHSKGREQLPQRVNQAAFHLVFIRNGQTSRICTQERAVARTTLGCILRNGHASTRDC